MGRLKRVGNRLCRVGTVLSTVECGCDGGAPPVADTCCNPRIGLGIFTSGDPVTRLRMAGTVTVDYFRPNPVLTRVSETYNINELVDVVSCPGATSAEFRDGLRGGSRCESNFSPGTFSTTFGKTRFFVRSAAGDGNAAVSARAEWVPEDAAEPVLTVGIREPSTSTIITANEASASPLFVGALPSGILLSFDLGYEVYEAAGPLDARVRMTGSLSCVAENIGVCPELPGGLLGGGNDPRALLTPDNAFKGGCCG